MTLCPAKPGNGRRRRLGRERAPIFLLCLLASSSCHRNAAVQAMSEGERVLYLDVTPVNASDCLHVIESLPLRRYRFKYDSHQRGRQLGVIGDELSSLLPEAVETVASRVFPNPTKGQPPITVNDVAVVDKNILFMYNIGAIQALADQQEALNYRLEQLKHLWDNQWQQMESMKARMEQQASQEAQEVLKAAELEREKEKLLAELARIQVEEETRLIDKQAAEERRHAETVARENEERLKKEHEMEMERTLKAIKAREEVAKKREEMRSRREMELKEKELEQMSRLEGLKREGDLARVKAEAQARADAERQNEDITLKRIRAQAEEDRKRALEMINLLMDIISRGALALLDDPSRLFLLVATFITFFACYYAVKEALGLVRHLIESQMGKPKLVRETSMKRFFGQGIGTDNGGGWIRAIGSSFSRLLGLPTSPLKAQSEEVVAFFKDVILPPDLRDQIYRLAVSTRNAKANHAPYRHFLLHGQPGTGKTMVAKRLAISSGMDYAIMSGGDVGPLGKEAVSELHKLFQWAERSSRGLLLFIDEAEAFLSARGTAGISEDRRNALNALLYQTGQQSYHFMMVLATNRPQDLDPAVLDRMDDYLGFRLPTPTDRFNMLRLYYNSLIVSRDLKGYDQLKEADFRAAAEALDRFSGREISKLMLSVLNAIYGTSDASISPELFRTIVKQKVEEHAHKEKLLSTDSDGGS